MSEKLMIEQLTENLDMEKQAEEAEMEKFASVINVVDQAQTLTAIGEDMYKIAEALENEDLAALAVDTFGLGERMGAALTKTASEDALSNGFEIAEDMFKVASVYADLADESNDETICKMAEAIIDISNEMTKEAEEAIAEIEEIEKEAGVKDLAKKGLDRVKGAAKSTGNAFSFKGLRDAAGRIKLEAARNGEILTDSQALKAALKVKGSIKENLMKPGLAYGGAATALAGAGYGTKKAFGKKD